MSTEPLMSGRDLGLTASTNTYRTTIRLTARPILLATLRELAEAWADDRERAIWAMDGLVQGLNRTEGGFDAAVYDVQANLRLSDTDELDVDVEAAERLIAELQIAVAKVQGRVTDLPRRSNGRAA